MASPNTSNSLLGKLTERFGTAGLAGMVLLVSALVAFIWANSPAVGSYESLLATELRIGIGPYGLEKALILWINDGLMAIFFLLVGLEIKREVVEGALSTRRRAALPFFAALGGIAVPAGIYALVATIGGGTLDGWAIPAATDIAFALGLLALLGKRVPVEVKVFLTAVAVVDDLGAILIIALFFTEKIKIGALIVAAATMVGLFITNRLGIRRNLPYVLLGIVLWVAVLKTGVHATLAGVALAMFIPAGRKSPLDEFAKRTMSMLNSPGGESESLAPDTALHRVRELCDEVEPPLIRWEHGIQPYALFFVMPIFALANAGVSLGGIEGGLGPVGWGVALGLLVGKPIGITLGAWIGVKMGVCELGENLTWHRLHGAAWLGGIGFTMSLFITGLALSGADASASKLGLLGASVIAGIIGVNVLLRACPPLDAAAADPSS